MYDDISSEFGSIIPQTGMVTLVAADDRQLSVRMKTQTTTSVPQCNTTARRMQIQSYIAQNWTSSSTDCTGNPYTGNFKFCQKACLKDITCVGFTRAKSASDSNSNAACYLKKNITGAGVYNSAT
ncbi:unnamed protein product [Adineta ricciae]|uniref:Apple domain-containing protein n=1 Tax=Adineta ricciae TaxID=249248 RepID=A0A814VJ27_ADIRI|nr:unnamed protein product [Adineta ricciae]CAF1643306.1 unnamed protein product [Adineta ricciae]